MDAWRYGIYLLVFTFDISLVRCAHSFDINVKTLHAPMYYSPCKLQLRVQTYKLNFRPEIFKVYICCSHFLKNFVYDVIG